MIRTEIKNAVVNCNLDLQALCINLPIESFAINLWNWNESVTKKICKIPVLPDSNRNIDIVTNRVNTNKMFYFCSFLFYRLSFSLLAYSLSSVVVRASVMQYLLIGKSHELFRMFTNNIPVFMYWIVIFI
jgi:hypothetical protein